jgi:hypothetical protein
VQEVAVFYRRGFWSTLMLVGLLATATLAADDKKATLKWKFEKDKPFYQEMSVDTTQNLKIMGSDVKNVQKQTFTFSWTPKDQDKDGNWTLKQKIEAVKMDFNLSGQPVSYDSTKESSGSNALGDFFKVLVGSEFTITLDKSNKVTKVEGRDDFLKKLTSANPQMEPLLKQILSEDALRDMADPTFAAVPAKEVSVGETWEKPSKLDMGPIGKYEVTNKYTYEGKDKANPKLDRIKVDTNLKWVKPTGAAGGGLPFQITDGDIKTTNASGFLLFDNDKGRLDSSEATLEIAGKLTISIAGQNTTVEMTQTQKTVVKGMDKNPVEPKK